MSRLGGRVTAWLAKSSPVEVWIGLAVMLRLGPTRPVEAWRVTARRSWFGSACSGLLS